MNKTSQQLHYSRGMLFINKIYKEVYKNFNKKKEKDFFVYIAQICRDNDIRMYDLNNFLLVCSICVMGLNKESIENENRSNEYKFNIKYLDIKEPYFKDILSEFQSKNTISTNLEKWLSVNRVSSNVSNNNNYLFNVRNAFMHSEYEHEFYNEDKYQSIILNLHNSNYTGFEGQVFLPNFVEFVKHYYSNDYFFGLLTNMYFLEMDKDELVFTKEDFHNQLKDIHLFKIKYTNGLNSKKITEKILFDNKTLCKYINKHPDDKEQVPFDDQKKKRVELLIKHYYGDSFFDMTFENQMRIIVGAYKYIEDPKIVISSWIMHFYNLTTAAIHYAYADEDFKSIFAIEPTIALMKSYMIMYRLQNSSFEEINYNDIEDFNYDIIENDLDVYSRKKNAWLRIDSSMLDEEIDKRYFCEIYRDALAHGKIKIDIEEIDGKLKQKLIFEDIYKSKKRVISVDVDELNKFINSKAFFDTEARKKENTSTLKR